MAESSTSRLGPTMARSERKAAREKFGAHFLTFWHLTYLACIGLAQRSKFRTGLTMAKRGGVVWTKKFSDYERGRFDNKFDKSFAFIEAKLCKSTQSIGSAGSTETAQVERKTMILIANYEKCLDIVNNFDYLSMDDNLNPFTVCSAMVPHSLVETNIFLDAPVLWTSLIVMRFYQLLLLAKDCFTRDKLVWFVWQK